MTTSTALAVHNGVLARIGTEDERAYLVGIMAETLGIPAHDSNRADVIAILGMAAQQTMTYGALPGIHLHVQKFESRESKEKRQRNPNLDPEYTYTLVQGEKLWKDSGARWRIMYGVNWTYQRKPMTKEELREQAQLMGYTDALPVIAYGMWSRVVMVGVDDPKDPDNPMWSSGLFLGKRKVGNSWFAEDLPTGVTSRDVAVRRADKRAMMQSSLTLIPLDDLVPAGRLERLTDHLRNEGSAHRGDMIADRRNYEVEPDGDILWAKDTSYAPAALTDSGGDALSAMVDEISDGEWEDVLADTPEKADARPEAKADARPETSESGPAPEPEDGPCPECHAPAGKPHATSCSRRGDKKNASEKADARPKTSAAQKADARPKEPAPVAQDNLAQWMEYASVLNNPDVRIDSDLAHQIIAFHDRHANSSGVLSEAQYKLLRMLFHSVFQAKDPEHKMFLSCICGTPIDHTTRPGSDLRDLIDWFKSPNKYPNEVALCAEILDLCRLVRQELIGT